MIYKTIKDDINPKYDPLHGETEDSQYISKNIFLKIDYMFAEITDDDQLLLTVSMKRNVFPKIATAMYLYFDMTFNYTNMNLSLTLDRVFFDEKEVSESVYGFILGLMNEEKIENAVDKGTIDLETYSYQVGFKDYLLPF